MPYFTSLAQTVRHERQLPPVRQRRHRRQPHHVRPRRRDLVQRCQRQAAASRRTACRCSPAPRTRARQRDREPEPGARHQQLVHRGRLRQQLQRRLSAALSSYARYHGGGSYTDCSDPNQPGVEPILDYLKSPAAPDRSALRAGPLLPAEQLQPGLLRQRQQRLHRHTTRPTRRSPFRRPRCRASATTERRTASPGSTTATSGTTTSTIPYQLNYGTPGRTPTSTATSAIRSSTTPPSCRTRTRSRRTSRTR